MFKLTLRELAARKLRLITTALAVMLGVAFMAGTLTLTDTIGATFDKLYAEIDKDIDLTVRSAESITSATGELRAGLSAELLDDLRNVDGVAAAAGTVSGYAQLVDKDGDAVGNPNNGAPTMGMAWVSVDEINPFELAEGRAPQADSEVVIDKGSADDTGFQLGDTATVLVEGPAQTVTIVGIATFGTADNAAGSTAVLFTPEAAQRFVGTPGEFDTISMVAEPGTTPEDLQARVGATLPASAEALTGAEMIAENQANAQDQLAFFNTFMLVFALIALFVGAFIIFNTFTILVAQRTKENALLRSLGASRKQVLGSVVLESVVVATIAVTAGITAGIGIAAGLKALMSTMGVDLPGDGLTITASTIVISALTGLVVTVVAALAPARKASKVAPIAAMRDSEPSSYRPSKSRVVAGVSIIALGTLAFVAGVSGAQEPLAAVGAGALLIFVGVSVIGPAIARPLSGVLGFWTRTRGMPGTLARQNAMRNPKRTATTAAALTIGVGLVGFITVFAASAKDSYAAGVSNAYSGDFVVNSGAFGFGGLPPELTDQLEALPEIDIATGERMTSVEVLDAAQNLEGIDPAEFPQLMDFGVASGRLEDLDSSGIAVVDSLAEDNGWALGDRIEVRFADTGPQQLTIQAIYTDKVQASPLIVSMATYEANVDDQFDMRIFIGAADGASMDAVRSALESAADFYPTASVTDRDEYIAEQLADVDMILNLIYVLLAFAVLIALMGITNTLALSIFERTREIGVLRAVGMDRKQLKATIRYESVIIALLGTALGLAVGLAFGYGLVTALADEGIDTFTVPFAELGVITVIATLAGIGAAVLPARRAARMDVLKAVTAT